MSRSTNNSESAKNSADEYKNNEKIKEIASEINLLNQQIKNLELSRERKIATHNRLAALHGLLQQEHIKLRDLYNSKSSK
jgi:hypothetical protein